MHKVVLILIQYVTKYPLPPLTYMYMCTLVAFVSHISFPRTGALRARLVRLVQPAKVETVQVNYKVVDVHLTPL